MQIFQEIQKSFAWMGFDPKLKPFNRRISSILAFTFTAVLSMWLFLICEADTDQEYMESMYFVSTCSGIFLSFASSTFLTKKLYALIEAIQESIIEYMEDPTTPTDKFMELIELIDKSCKIERHLVNFVAVPCLILPKTIMSFFVYFATDSGNDAFDLPLPMWIPYDWENPIGYLITVILQAISAKFAFKYIECFTSLALGGFMFATTQLESSKAKLEKFNQMANDERSHKNMYKALCGFIRRHSIDKQFYPSISDLYEITLTIVFVICNISICITLLLIQIKISHDDTDSIILVEAAVFGACAAILLLFVCELGQHFTDVIEDVDDVNRQLDWYLFSGQIQRALLIAMQNAQKPVVIKCFGNIACLREQFKKMVKTIYSYFMTLRKFYK